MSGKRLSAALCSLLMLFMLAMPAFAEDPQTTTQDLKGISAKRHRFLFSTFGGAAVGAGIGGGGASALYMHSHPHDNLGGWRNWAFIGSHTALGGGLGWTLCGCDDGLVAGSLIGGGASAWYQAAHAGGRGRTASTSTSP